MAPLMTPERKAIVRKLLAGDGSEATSSTQLALAQAHRATLLCRLLSLRLARFVGENGVNTLFKRSVLRVTQELAWLAYPSPWRGDDCGDPWLWIHTSMGSQDAETAASGFVLVLSAVVDLVATIVGEAVMSHILQDLWPASVPQPERATAHDQTRRDQEPGQRDPGS